jgi:putative chitinase
MAMPQITAAQLRQMSRTAAPWIVEGIVDNQHYIAQSGIDTPLRLCHFMAQLAHESAHFRTTCEFASGEAYEGRRDLGNTQPGDGPRFRGRGLIQTTGRANYGEARDEIRRMLGSGVSIPDFQREPDNQQLEQFPWALLAGIIYWQRRNLNRHADRDDIRAVTRTVNGGLNGLVCRIEYLAKAKTIWLGAGQPSLSHPVLRRGDRGSDVIDLQNELIGAGYHLVADGVFGQYTDAAVRDFQEANDLVVDGIVGARTWAMLLFRSGTG